MIFDEEPEPNPLGELTFLDIARLEDLELGEEMEFEDGTLKVYRYEDGYRMVHNWLPFSTHFVKLQDLIDKYQKS